jgi:bifunctional UDP-N-acetylglucosamine pyrophosphorylase/glucosamine-1-phosphate N-acetyltransferase
MIHWTIAAARAAGAGKVVCIVRPGEGVAEGLPDDVAVAEQTEGEGTGSAVLAARGQVAPGSPVVVLSGDHPLISAATITELLSTHAREDASATLLTTEDLDPAGYGRIVRNGDGSVARIVETKHPEGVDPGHLAIAEINLGMYAFDSDKLFSALDQVGEEHGERYLTTVFEIMRGGGGRVAAHKTHDTGAAMGVNDRRQLMEAETTARQKLIEEHALNGVTFTLPDTVHLDASVRIGQDTVIEPGTVLRGDTTIGAGCTVGPNSTLIDATIGNGAAVKQSWLHDCQVGDNVSIGPFAYIRPGTRIADGARIGTFVELKNSEIGAGSKVPHLSYLGDADVGEGANVAAGNITANYDGRAKHRTVIGNRVKTGVDTSLVAPVHVGDDAYTAAGSVITEDIPPGALGIARARQQNVEGYAERVEKERAEDDRQP